MQENSVEDKEAESPVGEHDKRRATDDSKTPRSYYYDDAFGYEDFDPDDDLPDDPPPLQTPGNCNFPKQA